MRRASVATDEVADDRAGVDRLDGQHVEGADAVDGDLEDEAERARGDQAHPQPGEGAGPDADRDRGEVLPDDAGLAHRPLDQRCELLAVAHRLLAGQLDHDVLAVVEGDGHARGGGVEGEQHGVRLVPTPGRSSSGGVGEAGQVRVDRREARVVHDRVPPGEAVDLRGRPEVRDPGHPAAEDRDVVDAALVTELHGGDADEGDVPGLRAGAQAEVAYGGLARRLAVLDPCQRQLPLVEPRVVDQQHPAVVLGDHQGEAARAQAGRGRRAPPRRRAGSRRGGSR